MSWRNGRYGCAGPAGPDGRNGRGRECGTPRPGAAGRTLYRSRHGKFLGVCRGLADYFGVSVRWLRLFFVLALLSTGIWPALIVYVLAAMLMKPEPVVEPADADEAEFYTSFASSRPLAVSRLKRKFESLDRRLRRMEDIVTSRDYDWDRRFKG